MPRTRSLAWSELKIGVLTIVAIVIAVATHMAQRGGNGKVEIVPATAEKESEAEFIMLSDGLICFEGDADALRSSKDPYIQKFLS